MKKIMITTLTITSVTLYGLQFGSSFVQAGEVDMPMVEQGIKLNVFLRKMD